MQATAVIHEQQQVGGAHSTVLGTRPFAFYTALVAFFTVKFLPLLRTIGKFLLREEEFSRPWRSHMGVLSCLLSIKKEAYGGQEKGGPFWIKDRTNSQHLDGAIAGFHSPRSTGNIVGEQASRTVQVTY